MYHADTAALMGNLCIYNDIHHLSLENKKNIIKILRENNQIIAMLIAKKMKNLASNKLIYFIFLTQFI